MRKYHLYAAVICTSLALAAGGCASKTQAKETPAASQETTADADKEAAKDTRVETVTGAIESMGESSTPACVNLPRIYGPVTKNDDGTLSMDNQSGVSSAGEIILTISPSVDILDAATGNPMDLADIEDGSIIYAYIGEAMTMSLPPMTNAELIFANVPADFKVPDYVEVKSVVTDAASSQSILTTADGTEYTLAEDCRVFPYLTRNIVTLDDLTQGRRGVVWSDEENTATAVMVFAE